MADLVTTNDTSPEMVRFSDALRQVVRVSKKELQDLLTKEKASKADHA